MGEVWGYFLELHIGTAIWVTRTGKVGAELTLDLPPVPMAVEKEEWEGLFLGYLCESVEQIIKNIYWVVRFWHWVTDSLTLNLPVEKTLQQKKHTDRDS